MNRKENYMWDCNEGTKYCIVDAIIVVAILVILAAAFASSAYAQQNPACSPPTNPIVCSPTGCTLEADVGFTGDAVPVASCKAFVDGSTTPKTGPSVPGAQSKCKSTHSQLANALICQVPLGVLPVGLHVVTAKSVSSDGQESVASLPLSFGVTAGPPTWGAPSNMRMSAP